MTALIRARDEAKRKRLTSESMDLRQRGPWPTIPSLLRKCRPERGRERVGLQSALCGVCHTDLHTVEVRSSCRASDHPQSTRS